MEKYEQNFFFFVFSLTMELCLGLVVALATAFCLAKRIEPHNEVLKLNGVQIIVSLIIIASAAYRAKNNRTLTPNAIAAACLLVLPIFVTSFNVGIAVLVFWMIAKRATTFGLNRKSPGQDRKTAYAKPAASSVQRNALQVVANSLAPCIFTTLAYLDPARRHKYFMAALAAVSSACADTCASEVTPVISDRMPRNITRPWEEVPIGSDGGVTMDGFLISFVGGCLPALPLWLLGSIDSVDLIICGYCGLMGSVIDSILGALFEEGESSVKEESRFKSVFLKGLLHNNDVNLISNVSAGLIACLSYS
eukprot:Gregarina_sp_Poly_1__2517@NODE_1681_length_3545_cov_85_334675_g1104_i0_p1_GENE_NODE_1681_length_3545_cov_85_334675_g1104_i0NODE_1681_length_3545_cov_85_334675_g1104_i0_p1_ORF_typecomplete_len307_score40_37DUF92/PF01940_16/5e03DUF92/PF01940_16/2e45DHHC/PF01529_20/7_1DHHC/PF01529_20/1_2e02TRP/PF06011_12/6_2TRP/PF06011_12/36EamA/PF00892_20/0_49EamA/PF00892_20/1_6e03EamA/PF00892_20/4_5e02_NODE_1681_length_3545_cov_85_334675_g1104_i020873007